MEWVHGENSEQDFWHCPTNKRWCIVRNLTEKAWAIYYTSGKGLCMIPNPFPSKSEVRFQEITRIPAHGKAFGEHPADDKVGHPSENYAWDSAAQCKMAVEVIEAYRRR